MKKRLQKRVLFVFIVFSIGLFMLGFFIKPILVDYGRIQAERILSRELNADISIGSADVSLWRMQVLLKDIKGSFHEGELREFSLKEIVVNPGVGPILAGKIFIDKIKLEEPILYVVIDPDAPQTQQTIDSNVFFDAIDLLELSIDSLELKGAKLSLIQGEQHFWFDIETGEATFSMGGRQGQWSWKGTASVSKAGSDQAVSIEELIFEGYRENERYAIKTFSAKLNAGEISGAGVLHPKRDLTLDVDLDLKQVSENLIAIGLMQEGFGSIVGSLKLNADFKGEQEHIKAQGTITLDEATFFSEQFKQVRLPFRIEKNILHLKGSGLFNRSPFDLNVNHGLKSQRTEYHLKVGQLPFDKINQWIDDEIEEPVFWGSLDVDTQGIFKGNDQSIEGSYHIHSDRLVLNLEDRVRRFLPLTISSVDITGAYRNSEAHAIHFTKGQIQAEGLKAEHEIEIFKGGGVKGYWTGELVALADLFESDYPISGRGNLSGGIRGEGNNLVADIRLGIEDLRYDDKAAISLGGNIIFEPGLVLLDQFEGKTGKGSAWFDAAFSGAYPEKEFIKAKFTYFPLDWISSVTSIAYPFVKEIAGVGSGQVLLKDFSTLLNGKMELESNQMTWKNIGFNHIDVDISVENGGFRFKRSQIKNNQSDISVSGFVGENQFNNFEIAFDNLLSEMWSAPPWLQKYFYAESGKVRFDGDRDNPQVTGGFTSKPVNMIEEKTFTTQTKLSGSLNQLKYELSSSEKIIESSGTVFFEDQRMVTQGNFNDLSLELLTGFQSLQATGHWKVEMDFRETLDFNGFFYLKNINAMHNEVGLYSDEKGVGLRLDKGRVFIGEASILDTQGNSVDIGGEIGRKNVDMFIRGGLGLEALSLLDLGIERSEGVVEADIRLRGTMSDIRFGGPLVLKQGFVKLKDFSHPFEELSMSATLDQNIIFVDALNGQIGEGTVSLSGDVKILSPVLDSELNFNGFARAVSLSFPEYLPSVFSGSAFLRGPLRGPTLGGEFDVEYARYTDRWDWQSKVLTFNTPQEIKRVYESDAPRLNFDMHFNANNANFRMQNNIADADLSADIRITGSTLSPGMLGRVDVKSGRVEFLDNIFEIKSGVILFEGENNLDIAFDLNAEARVGRIDIFLDIRSEGDDIVAFLTSQPPTDETNILSLLALGVEADELTIGEGGGDPQISSTFISGVLSSPIQSKLQSDLRQVRVIDTLQFVPYFSEQTRSSSLRMVVGKELSSRFRLLYSTDLLEVGSENALSLRQEINRNVFLRGGVRNNANNANREIDLGMDFEFRFDF